ncbi:ribosome maturation factor RimM [Bartonella sp. LJL80]
MSVKIDTPVQLAVIGAAHGTKGEVRVKSFTADPLDLASYGTLHDKNGRAFEIDDIRVQKNVVVVRFAGIPGRNEAEALNGTALYIDRKQLPDDLPEDEFYQTDLIGLKVKDIDGQDLGKVNALFDFGGGDLLELRLAGQKPVLVPFTKAAVPQLFVKEGYIVIDPVAAGLVADEDEDECEAEEQR